MVKIRANLYRLWSRRRYSLIIGIVSLGLVYFLTSRAIDTGSLQQYALAIVFFITAINRLAHTAFGR